MIIIFGCNSNQKEKYSNSIALQYSSEGAQKELDKLDSNFEYIDNSYKKAQKIEEYQIKKYAHKIQRRDSLLILKLENNKEIILKDTSNEDFALLYSFREYYDSLKIFVIELQYFEGGAYLIVNGMNGETQYIIGKTKLSPDMKKIVSYNVDIVAGYSKNGFQIIELKNNHFNIEYEYLPKDWGPNNINWLNNNEIEIEKLGLQDGTEKIIGKTNFILKDNWTEQK